MQQTKLNLSPQEKELVTNADMILTKNAVLQKVKTALEGVYEFQKIYLQQNPLHLPAEALANNGKISRGENYLGLPFFILDYPRNFVRENIFAIRSMFWWGKSISTTLHLSGEWKHRFKEKLLAAYPLFCEESFLLSIGEDEWVHDAASEHYDLVKSFSKDEFESVLLTKAFIKIAATSPIRDVENAPQIWQKQFKTIIDLLR